MPLSHMEQILERIGRSKCAYRSLHNSFVWDHNPMCICMRPRGREVFFFSFSHFARALVVPMSAYSVSGTVSHLYMCFVVLRRAI